MLNPAPSGSSPESKRPLSEVIDCGCPLRFVQLTLSPARMVTDGGSKPSAVIEMSTLLGMVRPSTALRLASDDRITSPKDTTPMAAHDTTTLKRVNAQALVAELAGNISLRSGRDDARIRMCTWQGSVRIYHELAVAPCRTGNVFRIASRAKRAIAPYWTGRGVHYMLMVTECT